MNVRSLLYHDVVDAGGVATSGFTIPGADIYKLLTPEFEEHLTAIQQRTGVRALSVSEALSGAETFLLTFDDGGTSALTHIAPMLERYGAIGHFFITADRIGTNGFLSKQQIVELAHGGHVIGSHSCSHPLVMSALSRSELEREWRDSVARISDILGAAVTVASVPGGSYSAAVGETAAAAGVQILFTSEPTAKVCRRHGCTLLGRYSVQHGTPAQTAAALATGGWWPCFRQWGYWNFKKLLKRGGGPLWIEFRNTVLSRRAQL